MNANLFAAAACLLLVALAGCSAERRPQAVDFGDVDESQAGANFLLHVRVVGVGNETLPISGAFVGAANGNDAIAKSETDASGEAILKVRKGQTIRIVAKADGWTTEDSGEIAIGDTKSEDSDHCGSFTLKAGGTTQTQGWCVVTASDTDAETHLDGDDGSVGLVLFRKVVDQAFKVRVEPHANLYAASLPDGKTWFPQSKALNDDPDLHRLYMLRLVQTTSTVKWRNNMLEQGDFELGMGCVRETPAARTTNNVPYLATQTAPVTVTKDWNPKAKGSWAECPTFFAGPIVDTVNSAISVDVTTHLVFNGKSLIIPLNAA